MIINENIRRLRMEAGLSQEELGKQLGVSRQAVSKWEMGMTAPDISLLPQLAEALGVSIDAMFAPAAVCGNEAYGSYRARLVAQTASKDAGETEFRQAMEAYADVIMAGEASTADWAECGRLYFRRAQHDLKAAERHFRRAIEEGDTERNIHWLGARKSLFHLQKMTGRHAEAVSEARAWAEKEPDCSRAHAHLALVLMESGTLDEAYDEVCRALAIDPADMDALTCAGDVCGKLEKYPEAIGYWDRAYEADSSSISCLFSKAEAYVQMGKAEKAVAQYEEILGWLQARGYDMKLESEYPMRRIEEIRRMAF